MRAVERGELEADGPKGRACLAWLSGGATSLEFGTRLKAGPPSQLDKP
jgi:hypothetical protein